MNFRKSVVAGVVALAALVSAPLSARATIVERVVAVVGDRPILLTELRHRARPFLARISATVTNPAQQAAAETEMFRDLLNRMIDDRLEEVAADKARLGVTSEEVDNAIKNIAGNARLSVKELVSEAKRQGLSEQDYRDEIRRQVLEGKLVQLRVRGRVRVTEDEARNAYGRWLRDVGDEKMVDLRVLALRLAPGQDPEERQGLAANIAERARAGEDFCKLVQQYSEDVQTKNNCGSRGPQPSSALIAPLQSLALSLKAGEVGDPLTMPGEAILVTQLAGAPRVPAFEDVHDSMMERAYAESMERQRKQWLGEIRRGVYIDVRL